MRTTVRCPKREADVRAMLKVGGAEPGDRLSFMTADLESDGGWAEAVAGCDYVLHVASPFPPNIPKHEDELIIPAREGALRVLRAARDAGVRRVILTSSFAVIGYGKPQQQAPFVETNWTDPNSSGATAYVKSKTLGRTRRLGLHREQGRPPRAFRRQPGGRVRPGAGSRFFDLDHAGETHAGRRHARRPASVFRRGRCA